MTTEPITTYFDSWLDKNIDRFAHKPIKIEFNRYKFDGIIDNIVLVLDDTNCEAMIECSHNDTVYDCISLGYIEDLVFIDDKGYTDSSWVDKYKDKFYTSYEDMIVDNLFNPIASYCNDKFIPNNHLYLVNINNTSITFGSVK